MDALLAQIRKNAGSIAALVCCATIFAFSVPSKLSPEERHQMAARFSFQRNQLPEPKEADAKKHVRKVHPSLHLLSSWISATGASIALTDIDGDGVANDVISIDPRVNRVSVLPAPGTQVRFPEFQLTPKKLPFDSTMAPMGVLTGDVNEDGLQDIIVLYWGRTPIAFMHNSDAQGTPSAASFSEQEVAKTREIWNTTSGALADFDGDGHLDLLACNYFCEGAAVLNPHGTGTITLQDSIAHALNGGCKHLFRGVVNAQDKSVQFVEQKHLFTPDVDRGWTIATGVSDLDGDMLPEIYLANDTGPDRLLHNRSSPGKFKFVVMQGQGGPTIPTSFVMGQDSFKGMGCDFGDINNDGVPDIYVSNIAAPYGLEESHYLWLSNHNPSSLQQGIAPYRQASEEFGISRSGWGWDCRLVDLDNDGILEALQATGFLKGNINRWPELQSVGSANSLLLSNPANWPTCFRPGADVSGSEPNCLWVRSTSGKYYDIGTDVGVGDTTVSRGIAIGDIDADGRPDFAVANQWEPSFVFKNNSAAAGNKSITLKLLRPVANATPFSVKKGAIANAERASAAIGAKAILHLATGGKRCAFIDGGSGHSGKRAQEIHFGLGKVGSDSKHTIDLTWRDREGKIMNKSITLEPGWYTIVLGSEAATK